MIEPKSILAAILMFLFLGLLFAITGCGSLSAYNSSVTAREIGFDGKTTSYRIEYAR